MNTALKLTAIAVLASCALNAATAASGTLPFDPTGMVQQLEDPDGQTVTYTSASGDVYHVVYGVKDPVSGSGATKVTFEPDHAGPGDDSTTYIADVPDPDKPHLDAPDNTAARLKAQDEQQHQKQAVNATHLDASKHIEPGQQTTMIALKPATFSEPTTTITPGTAATSAQVVNHNFSALDQRTTANSQRIDQQQKQINSMSDRQDDDRQEARAGVAGVAAMANIPQVSANGRYSFGAGVGTYHGENAMAVGASFHTGEHVISKFTVSSSTEGDVAAGAGLSVEY